MDGWITGLGMIMIYMDGWQKIIMVWEESVFGHPFQKFRSAKGGSDAWLCPEDNHPWTSSSHLLSPGFVRGAVFQVSQDAGQGVNFCIQTGAPLFQGLASGVGLGEERNPINPPKNWTWHNSAIKRGNICITKIHFLYIPLEAILGETEVCRGDSKNAWLPTRP